jgi:hypothetical protein
MVSGVLMALGAICILAGIAFVYVGKGAGEGDARFRAFGFEISVQKAGQAGVTLFIGAALLVIGAHDATRNVSSAISVVSYVRNGTNQRGEFRRSGSVWIESFEDLNTPRYWTEVADAPAGHLRLASQGAAIDIDPKTMAIGYSDGGKPFRPLDTITSIERASR